jgi:hypothetical protein
MNLPLEFLFNASEQTLMDAQLASFDRGSRHLKAAKVAWNAAIDEFVAAEMAAIFRERRAEILERARQTLDAQSVMPFPERKRA